MNWSITEALRAIEKTGRPLSNNDRQSSSQAAYLVRHGFAKRVGFCWSKLTGRQVAEYELSVEGISFLKDNEE